VFEDRGGSSWAFLGKTSQPDRALRNLLDRDRLFTYRLTADTERLNLRTVEVDGTLSEEAVVEHVVRAFGC